MLRKIVDTFGYLGLGALVAGTVYYNVTGDWDWRTQAAVYGGAGLLLVYLVAGFPRLREGLSTRSARYGGMAVFSVLLVIGILVLLNFLNFRHHKRFDLTETGIHTLSDQTRRVVSGLTAPVRVLGFFTDDQGARRFQELMREYRYVSPQFEFEVIDPQREPGRVSEYEIGRSGQVVVEYAGRRETLDDFNEERITNAVIRVTRDRDTTVYFLQGHGERDTEDTGPQGYSLIREALERQNFRVSGFNLAQEDAIPEGADLIVAAGPQVEFFPGEVEHLNRYLEEGGRFLLLVDPETEFVMDEFLAPYGLGLADNVVIDVSGVGRLFGLGPAVPLVSDYSDHPITREMSNVMTMFPMAQSVVTRPSDLDFESSSLLRTSSRSFAKDELIGEEVRFDEDTDLRGPLDLAAVAVRPVDPGDPEEGPGNDAEEPIGTPEARFVLFGDSDFASNAYFRSGANGDLFLNTVSWLVEDEDLIAIRPRDPENRQVNLTVSQSRVLFWVTVILLPVGMLLFGVSVWIRRR